MHRLFLALAFTLTIGIGIAIGALYTRSARAETNPIPNYVIIPVHRVEKSDPIAVKMNTFNGQVEVIRN
ncbi:MAG: hypothetical protein ACYC7E_06015 [Armatimonadota bacterium]